MNREIKFRVYQKHKSRMLGWKDIQSWVMSDLNFADSEAVFMQYTGLHDKNGKEIYEGDIVRILYTDWGSKEYGTPEQQAMSLEDYLKSIAKIKVVIWSHNGFYVSHKIGGYAESMEPGTHGYIEIIGNIYENPTLLSKDK